MLSGENLCLISLKSENTETNNGILSNERKKSRQQKKRRNMKKTEEGLILLSKNQHVKINVDQLRKTAEESLKKTLYVNAMLQYGKAKNRQASLMNLEETEMHYLLLHLPFSHSPSGNEAAESGCNLKA